MSEDTRRETYHIYFENAQTVEQFLEAIQGAALSTVTPSKRTEGFESQITKSAVLSPSSREVSMKDHHFLA